MDTGPKYYCPKCGYEDKLLRYCPVCFEGWISETFPLQSNLFHKLEAQAIIPKGEEGECLHTKTVVYRGDGFWHKCCVDCGKELETIDT